MNRIFAAGLFALLPGISSAQEWTVKSTGNIQFADEKRLVCYDQTEQRDSFLYALDSTTGAELCRWQAPKNDRPKGLRLLGTDRLNFNKGNLVLTSGVFEAFELTDGKAIAFDRIHALDAGRIRAFKPDLTPIFEWKSTIGSPTSYGITEDAIYVIGTQELKPVLAKIGMDGKLAWLTSDPELSNHSFSLQPTRLGVVALVKSGARIFSLDKGKAGKTWPFPKPVTRIEFTDGFGRVVEDATGTYVAWQWDEAAVSGNGKETKTTNTKGLRLLDLEHGWRKVRAFKGRLLEEPDRPEFHDGLALIRAPDGPHIWNFDKDTEVPFPATSLSRPAAATGEGLLAFVRLDLDKKQAYLQVRALGAAERVQEWPVGTEKWIAWAIASASQPPDQAKVVPVLRRLKKGFLVSLDGSPSGEIDGYYLRDGASAPVEIRGLGVIRTPVVERESGISTYQVTPSGTECRTWVAK